VKTIKADREKYIKSKEENNEGGEVSKTLKRATQSQKVVRGKYDKLPKLTKINDEERKQRKKEAAEYMNEVKKKYNLGEIGDNFQKRAKNLPKDQL